MFHWERRTEDPDPVGSVRYSDKSESESNYSGRIRIRLAGTGLIESNVLQIRFRNPTGYIGDFMIICSIKACTDDPISFKCFWMDQDQILYKKNEVSWIRICSSTRPSLIPMRYVRIKLIIYVKAWSNHLWLELDPIPLWSLILWFFN